MRVLLPLLLTAAASLHAQSTLPPQAPSTIPTAIEVTAPPSDPSAAMIRTIVDSGHLDGLRWPDFSDYRAHLRHYYDDPSHPLLLWIRNGQLTPQARSILGLFGQADDKGIHSADYDGGRWTSRIANRTSDPQLDAARLDLFVTINLMRYISDLHIGRINPRNIRFALDIESKKYYLPRLVAQIATMPDPAAFLASIEPQYDEYKQLQTVYNAYRKIAVATGAEKPLPVVRSLKPGDTYAGLPELVRLLQRVGDLPVATRSDPNTRVYSEPVTTAVKRFQRRHGLEADGVISAKTFHELNVPLAQRVRQIEWALERWRWAPMEFNSPPIIVNIPEFVVRAWDANGRTALAMPVVVGKAYTHETPVFEGRMQYLVLRPYWNVTPNIQRSELVPKLSKDRDYLARNRYEIVDDYDAATGTTVVDDATLAKLRTCNLLIRQKPGPDNSLGLIKFVFPNQNNIYLHSTPAQTLFSRSRRDFSHGCIRVADPLALAEWVLRDDPSWAREKLDAAMKTGPDNFTVVLKTPIPVFIVYSTVTIGESGEVHFYDDIYNHDVTLENALAGGYPYPG